MTWKLVAAYVGWLLAAFAIALLFGLVIGELAALFRIVEAGSENQQRVVEVTLIAAFVLLGLLPFLLRKRLLRSEEGTAPGEDS